jgi:hypothetical protein
MQSITNSIAGLISVAECERDEYGRFAPRRAKFEELSHQSWWMAL